MWRRGEEDEWADFLGRRVLGWDESVGWFFIFSLELYSFILQQDNTRNCLFHIALLWSPGSLMFPCTTQQISTHLKPLIWMGKELHCWEQAKLFTPYDQIHYREGWLIWMWAKCCPSLSVILSSDAGAPQFGVVPHILGSCIVPKFYSVLML